MAEPTVTISLVGYIAKTANTLVQGCISGALPIDGMADGHNGKGPVITLGELAEYLQSHDYGLMISSAEQAGYAISVLADTRASVGMIPEGEVSRYIRSISPNYRCNLVVVVNKREIDEDTA